jgi:hypothetical protein
LEGEDASEKDPVKPSSDETLDLSLAKLHIADNPQDTAEEDTLLLLEPGLLEPLDFVENSFIERPLDSADDEILEALRASLDQDDNFDHPDLIDFDQDYLFLRGELENIEVDDADQENLDVLDYDHIFDSSPSPVEVPPTESPTNLIASLEQELVNLTLDQMPNLQQDQFEDLRGDEEDDEELPWYTYCQPCNPLYEEDLGPSEQDINFDEALGGPKFSRLAAIKENHPLQDGRLAQGGPYTDQDQWDGGPFELMSTETDQSLQPYNVSRRPNAVAAALSFTQSFGTGIYQPVVEDTEPPNEKQYFGHRENIYCIEFSPCGQYLASASQDSTVRIWDVAKHRLLQTLTGHSTEYECLRVTW